MTGDVRCHLFYYATLKIRDIAARDVVLLTERGESDQVSKVCKAGGWGYLHGESVVRGMRDPVDGPFRWQSCLLGQRLQMRLVVPCALEPIRA